MSTAPVERNAGLAVERTSLAWNRTSLALLINGVLAVVHHERSLPEPMGVVLLVACVATAVAVTVHAVRRARLARLSQPPTVPPRAAVLALGLTLVVVCVGTAVSVAVAALD